MNKRRMEAVLRRIKAEPKRWFQGSWHAASADGKACHTKHCIAGWAEALMFGDRKGKRVVFDSNHSTERNAREYLDLTFDQAGYLFYVVSQVSQIEKFIESGGELPKKYRASL